MHFLRPEEGRGSHAVHALKAAFDLRGGDTELFRELRDRDLLLRACEEVFADSARQLRLRARQAA